jgi:tetratricopeptide (TPR) repeat protein
MRITRLFIFAFVLVWSLAGTAAPRATAQGGEDALAGEDRELCVNAPLAGAQKVFVVVRDNDQVLLVGMKGAQRAWQKSFPLNEAVNKAKTYVECKGQAIELHSQQPFSAAEIIQVFSWDGRRLKYVSTRYEDPSAEFIERMVRAAETGDNRTLRPFLKDRQPEGEVEVMYPYAYITRRLFADALRRGHRAATRLSRRGRTREAATRLSLMFEVTARLNAIVSADEIPSKTPERWLQAWKSQELRAEEYAYALNDYGYFLQQAGDDRAAIGIFETVIAQEPNRAVAYLNLADSLWTLNRKAEAREHYKTYRQLMVKAERLNQIPARVAVRLS